MLDVATTNYARSLCLDLETMPDGRILKIAAWRADTQQSVEFKGKFNAHQVQIALDALSEGARYVMGHNVLQHDWPLLQQFCPSLTLFALPVVDTLLLSPIAFPRNPYHRLVKDYKLLHDAVNEPLADAKLSWSLFQEQFLVFQQREHTVPDEMLCLHYLLTEGTSDSALSRLFGYIRRQLRLPLVEEVAPAMLRLLGEKVCQARLQILLQEDLPNTALRWPLAYAFTWLGVAGGNSVLPPWVAQQFPETVRLLRELRDVPCLQPDCGYCQFTHDPRAQLKHYFGFDDFRPLPRNVAGGSLQADIVAAGMRGEHLLAILPTGGGKSLCYQLPALNRYWRNGSLTIIISPLQSLMKDQVDNLARAGILCAATLNGQLTPMERHDVLNKVRLGDVGILLVSPEQLRNKGFREAIKLRRIGAWVFDEAHCLSRWGQDFRPDYWFAARFIHEQHCGDLPLIACFTATAKQEVIADLRSYFQEKLGIGLTLFQGGHERSNLQYEIINVTSQTKVAYVHQLLQAELGSSEGGAVVFVAKRKSAEDIASQLRDMDWDCRHFHAGLSVEDKKQIQDDFIAGRLRVIVATNAFGMGVDKQDVRVVIHAEIPGSLENYLQEAGRAGRDQQASHCVLLYDEKDVEAQFGLAARSQLSMSDIQAIFRVLRGRARKAKNDTVIISAGEILADDEQDSSIEAGERDADTRVVTAISWLERARLLRRDENQVSIYPSSLKILSHQEVEKVLQQQNLSAEKQKLYLQIWQALANATETDGISVDELMLQTGQSSQECVRILHAMEKLGILSNDMQIAVQLSKGVAGQSSDCFARHVALEKVLLARLPEWAPDADERSWQSLNLRALCQALKDEMGDDVLPDAVLLLLRIFSQPFNVSGSELEQRPAFVLKKVSREHYQIKVRRAWRNIREVCERRQIIAGSLLSFLLGRLAPQSKGKELTVTCTLGELCAHLQQDLALQGLFKDETKALEAGLLYLHATTALRLDRGRTVFRSAMTITMTLDEGRNKFLQKDYAGLLDYYQERTFQVHVMQEYARLGLQQLSHALAFVAAYFREPKGEFIKRYFADRKDLLLLATTEESVQRIVRDLQHPLQEALVTDRSDKNHLVLAGPGSGKTRVIVHRVAYLLRIMRMPAEGIIVLTFNRHAAHEIRKRLFELVGAESYGVTVLTYHAMAMRLTGTSFQKAAEKSGNAHKNRTVDEGELDALIRQAAKLLRDGVAGNGGEDEDKNDLRERLLRGYRYILVDEYQDIDTAQYELISALSGRTLNDEQTKLTLFAVGDDDQHIYTFRERDSSQFIQRFQQDYAAKLHYLVENYRSSAHIIQTANQVIAAVPNRLKQAHPIRINDIRVALPPGGAWAQHDPVTHGRVHILSSPADPNIQAQLVMAELLRLQQRALTDWSNCAVLARKHELLKPLRAYCEQHGIPCQEVDDSSLALHQVREGQGLIRLLAKRRVIRRADLQRLRRLAEKLLQRQPNNPWRQVLLHCVQDFCEAWAGVDEVPASLLLDEVYAFGREQRRVLRGKLVLSTVHAAKGQEFTHVCLLDGGWRSGVEEVRLYYVGMTRAKKTLALLEYMLANNPCSRQLQNADIVYRSTPVTPRHDPALDVEFMVLQLADVFIDFAGRRAADDPLHQEIAHLQIGDPLRLEGRSLRSMRGIEVGQLAKNFVFPAKKIQEVAVHAIAVRNEKQSDEQYRERLKCSTWEVVLCRLRLQ